METFFNHKSGRWFWANLIFVVLLAAIYAAHSPIGGASGSTFLGYTYGVISLLGMLVLMWYGIRKRSYRSTQTPLKGALAAHIWLGVALMVIVPLHAGFRFGLNVHTLAYALMVVVILSGIWGAINYATLARAISSHRGEGSMVILLQQIEGYAADIAALMRDKSDSFIELVRQIDFKFSPSIFSAVFRGAPQQIDRAKAADIVAGLAQAERDDAIKLITIINKKREIAGRVCNESRVKFWLKAWLYFHLPVSIALCVVVAIHIVSVFYYH